MEPLHVEGTEHPIHPKVSDAENSRTSTSYQKSRDLWHRKGANKPPKMLL